MILEKLSKEAERGDGMSSAVEMKNHINGLIAGERVPLKAAIPVIARMLGLTPRRVKALRYGEARRIEPHELQAARAATTKQQVLDAQRQATRLEAMAARLATADAEFHAADIAAARALADRLRNLTR